MKLISYIGPASITQFPQYTAKTGTRIWKVSSYFIEPLPSVPYPNLRKNRESVHQDTPPLPVYTPATPLLPRGASMRAPTPLTLAPQLTTSVARSAACAHQYSTGRPKPASPLTRYHLSNFFPAIQDLTQVVPSSFNSPLFNNSPFLLSSPPSFSRCPAHFGSSAPSHISGRNCLLYSARPKFYPLTLESIACTAHVRNSIV